MSLPDRQIICTRPFEWFEIHPDGSAFLCCPAWLKRPVGNLLEQPVEQIWNGPVAREIRTSVLNGSFHNCNRNRCPHLTAQASSQRSSTRDAPLCLTDRVETPEIPASPIRLNLCYDLSCNLACPSCRPRRLHATGTDRRRAERIDAIVLEQLIPHAREITLSGFGDPFGSPTYLALLQQLNQQPGSLPQLRLHSNGQLWTRERWDTLPNLHRQVTEAEISVDAGRAETYTLNRPGGSFSRLLTNLEYLSCQPFTLKLSMVVQQNNFREIPDLLELASRLGAKVYLSQLVNWGTFSREEYARRAIHLPSHPEHQQLRALLGKISSRPAVDLGNLYFILSER